MQVVGGQRPFPGAALIRTPWKDGGEGSCDTALRQKKGEGWGTQFGG
jgi:glycerate kinase